MEHNAQTEWADYCRGIVARLRPILASIGYELLPEQPHLLGERALTRPQGGARKLVLLGIRTVDGMRVVIKASDEALGAKELRHEHECRELVERLPFAYEAFPAPKELLFTSARGFTLLVSEYLAQDTTFLERPLLEQFILLLSALKAQESAHATTHEHLRRVARTFGSMTGKAYGDQAHRYEAEILEETDGELKALLARASARVVDACPVLEQYGSFLTHWDLTPQNFRVHNGTLYFLDLSSLRFGNKYEGWARLVNFMTLYNPPLAAALVEYVHLNRTAEEVRALEAMRIYRLLELIRYYVSWLARIECNLLALTHARIAFWSSVLTCVLEGMPVPGELIADYTRTRDSLRSADEKKRQEKLH
jgi:hypothetical protein